MMAPVTRIVGGKKYHGDYAAEKSIAILSSEFGQKRAQLGSLPPEHLAGMLLAEQISAYLLKQRTCERALRAAHFSAYCAAAFETGHAGRLSSAPVGDQDVDIRIDFLRLIGISGADRAGDLEARKVERTARADLDQPNDPPSIRSAGSIRRRRTPPARQRGNLAARRRAARR